MIKRLCGRYPELAFLEPTLTRACSLLHESIITDHKIMTCGNGGSAADAEHIVGELMKSFLLPRPLTAVQQSAVAAIAPEDASVMVSNLQRGIPALSLVSGTAFPTAFTNDVSAEFVFAQQVLSLGKPGDVLWGISTSGNSKNILQAFRVAKAFGIKTLGLTGRDGGQMAGLCDVEIRVPSSGTPDIQEMHLPIYHAICAELEKKLFGNYTILNKNKQSVIENIRNSKLIVFDFDGIFTDNFVYIDQEGKESVRCSRGDSLGLNLLHKDGGPPCCILSTETNPVVARRAEKLGIPLIQGCSNKKQYLLSYLQTKNISPADVLYMGNDLNDLDVMLEVGSPVAPSDAHPRIQTVAKLVLNSPGGNGAVRELCDLLINK